MNIQRFVNFRYIFYPFLAFLFGIIVARGFYQADIEILIVTLILLLALGAFLIYRKKTKILLILFSFFFIGNGFYFIGEATYHNKDYSGQVLVVGRVSDSFEENDYSYTTLLKNASINGEKCRNIRVVFTKNGQNLNVGDIVSFEGEVESVKPFSLNTFNSSAYRSNTGYYCFANLENCVISEGYTTFDEKIRLAIKDDLYENMSSENAAVAYAVLFGDQSGIAFETQESYRDSGIIHILTVSGLNITFLISIIFGLLKLCRCNKYVNFAITTLVIIIYTTLCGFTPSVLRASIMGIIMMGAGLLKKRYDSLNALGVAGFAIVLFRPLNAFDVGFLMSIACVCGIILLYQPFYNVCKKFMPDLIAQYIAISLSAQLTILPFLALFSSSINLLSFIINLFIVPLFSIIFPWLFFASIICLIMPFMAFLLVPVGWGFSATKFIAVIFSATSLQIQMTPFAFSVIIFFFLLVFLLSQMVMCKKLNKLLLCATIIFGLSCSYGFSSIGNKLKPSLTYLNSYSEECLIIKNTSNETIMIGDCYLTERYLHSVNQTKIDYYISFEDVTSHMLPSLENYNIGSFLTTSGELDNQQITILDKNQTYRVGNFEILFLEVSTKLIGININFDQIDIFVANSSELDYNDRELFENISQFNPDIVVLGEDYYLAQGKDYISISSERNDVTTLNYGDMGNFIINFNNEQFAWGRLD